MGFLDRLFGRKRKQAGSPVVISSPEDSPGCDCCGRQMTWNTGYGLTTEQVTTQPRYWKIQLKKLVNLPALMSRETEPRKAEVFIGAVQQMAGQSSAWLICESCADLLDFDREQACRYNSRSENPPGVGPANLEKSVAATMAAWVTLYGKPPFGNSPTATTEPAAKGPLKSSRYGKLSDELQGEAFADYLRFTELQANAGDAGAQNNLATIYAEGDKVPRDHDKAMTLFRKAAAQGNIDAFFNLVVAYTEGRGVEVDEREGCGWFLKAAERRHEQAMLNVAAMYATGRGVAASQAETLRWIKTCADLGSERAQAMMRELKSKGIA